MKKGDVIDLIKYHYEHREPEFRDKAVNVARYFDVNGDHQLAEYIMGLMNPSGCFFPQCEELGPGLVAVKPDSSPLPLPVAVMNDLKGVINAVGRGVGINKFLFVGAPGTGKTESSKHVARLLGRQMLQADFSSLVDSRLGQTAKNIVALFNEISRLPFPERHVILFDEIDTIALDRINRNDVREMGRVTSAFFKSLEAVPAKTVIIATTNLFSELDRALIRRFDAVIDFDRYSPEDKIEVGEAVLDSFMKQFKNIARDTRLFRKILKTSGNIPNPGELKNLIRTSLAFSDASDPYDYLKRIMKGLSGGKIPSLSDLHDMGFTVREMEILTGISKSSVSRELKEDPQ